MRHPPALFPGAGWPAALAAFAPLVLLAPLFPLVLALATAGGGPKASSGTFVGALDAATVEGRRGVTAAIVQRGGTVPLGTGVLVAPGLVLTAMHVTRVHAQVPLRYDPACLEIVFDLREGGRSRRHRVLAWRWTSDQLDAALLEIGEHAAEGPAPAPLRRGPVPRGSALYALHHGGGAAQQVAGPFAVHFPYAVDAAGLAALPKAARASYSPAGTQWQLRGPRWGHHPTLGVAFDAPPGSSGAPVFDARTHELVGIVYAHSPQRHADPWVDHGAVLPIEALLQDLPHDLAALLGPP